MVVENINYVVSGILVPFSIYRPDGIYYNDINIPRFSYPLKQ